ncbi:glycosyltransferase [Methylobacterium sp. WL122]|nr:glycosyltransferase [Methylobacterium sp. WL122]
MTNPLVSIIIPSYNHERYIIKCLESVVNQEYKPIEIILIDDGSRDKTADLAESYLNTHAPKSIVIRRKNNGAANAINQAIKLSSGHYINILNSDDYFSRSRISMCVDLCLRQQAEFVFAGINFIDENNKNCQIDNYIMSLIKSGNDAISFPSIGFALMKNQLAISTGNFFFSRTLYNKLGGFRSYLYVHDWDFILRSLYYTEPLVIKEKLYNYRFHGENSYKSLENIAGYETSEVMRNFLWLMTSHPPLNGTAPCPFYWPGVFERFVRKWNYEVYLPPRYRRTALDGMLVK